MSGKTFSLDRLFLETSGTIMLTGLGLDSIMLRVVYSVESFSPTIKFSPETDTPPPSTFSLINLTLLCLKYSRFTFVFI